MLINFSSYHIHYPRLTHKVSVINLETLNHVEQSYLIASNCSFLADMISITDLNDRFSLCNDLLKEINKHIVIVTQLMWSSTKIQLISIYQSNTY